MPKPRTASRGKVAKRAWGRAAKSAGRKLAAVRGETADFFTVSSRFTQLSIVSHYNPSDQARRAKRGTWPHAIPFVVDQGLGFAMQRFVKALTLIVLAGWSVLAEAQTRRPNILFAFADDWGRYASAYAKLDGPGTINDIIRTPNFDRVAREGVLFRRAFVSAPSCTPCRSAVTVLRAA